MINGTVTFGTTGIISEFGYAIPSLSAIMDKYFQVPEYGKSGCDATQPEGKPGVIQNLVSRLNILTRTIGLD